ncbi:MAG: formate dehydrogenase accessory sulfurtransferase FdhD, partial [Limisphaerales bacterium]
IRVETRSIAVVMRTPGHDEELAAGFLLSEGILRDRAALRSVRPHPRNAHGNVVDAHLADGVKVDLSRFTRHVFASSSCGLCGVATLEAVRRQFRKVVDRTPVSIATMRELAGRLGSLQEGFAATGGLHAAALVAPDGRVLAMREDVGRHNAVDKVVGRLFLDGLLPVAGGVLWVSGRASFEIVQKALAAGIPVIAAVGAPSSLAIDFARANGQTLVGFLRDGRFNVYSGPRRLRA